MTRAYCTIEDVKGFGADKPGDLLDFVRSASQWIETNIGNFTPIVGTKRFDGTGDIDLTVDPILSVTSITDDGDSLDTTDYLLYPRNKWYDNGPYTRIRIDPDALTLNAWTWEEDIVAIVGSWGLYSETEDTGATTTQADNSTAAMVVDDASKIYPGAVLLVETEQEFVTGYGSATDSNVNLAEALDASEEDITTGDGTAFNIGEIIKIDFEQMRILDIQGNDLYVTRGWNKTKRTTHADTTDIYIYRTFTVERGANGTVAAAHTSKTVSRYVVPFDVKYLCKQMASLMRGKEDSNYAGKTANIELGEVFYMDEFPNKVLDRVKAEYMKPRRFGK